MNIEPILISEYLGLNRLDPLNKMDPRHGVRVLNWDPLTGTLRPRPSIAKTSFLDSAGSPAGETVRVLQDLHTLDGGLRIAWIQGNDLYAATSPKILGAAVASGTQLDSALTRSTYPMKFRDPASTYFMAEINGSLYVCNGQDAPLRYSPETGLQRWSIFQPRELVGRNSLSPPDWPNHTWAHQEVGSATWAPSIPLSQADTFAWGPLRYAYTWFNAHTGEESNPSPILDFSDPDLVGGPAQVPPSNSLVGYIKFQGLRPPDSQVTHIRLYRSLSGGTNNDLRRMAQVELPPAGVWSFEADVTTAGHLERYSDHALLNAPPLEFDHFCVPPLAGVIQHRNYLHGWLNWQESYLPGRTALTALAARATTTTGNGHVITISQVAGGLDFRVHEAMVGWLRIRLPSGSNRAYEIMDVNESAQTIRIGSLIGAKSGDFFDELDTDDENLTNVDFVLEAPNYLHCWSKRDQPGYWPGYNSRPIGRQDGTGITSMFTINDVVVIAKANRLYSNQYESSPAVGDGRVRVLSHNVGMPSPHGVAVGDDFAEFQHYSGIYRTDGGRPVRVSGILGFGLMGPGAFSAHDRVNRRFLHFAVQTGDGAGCFVHQYDRGRWSRWEWAGRTFTAGLSLVDADGIERVYLSTSDGYHYAMHDSFGGVGVADGHASLQDSLFYARSFCTAPAAVGTVIDTTNRFPDHTTTGASLMRDPIRVIAGKGAGQTGVVSGRVSDNQLTVTGFTESLDETSEYEIGYVSWFYQFPWSRAGLVAHTVTEVQVLYVPKSFNAIGERFRHDKRLTVQMRSEFRESSLGTFVADDLERNDTFDHDAGTGIPLVELSAASNDGKVDYTNSVYAGSPAAPIREESNPGWAHVYLNGSAPYISVEVGESGVKIKGEIVELALSVVGMEERA